LFAAHQLSSLLHKEEQNLHGDTLDFENPAGAAQLPSGAIEFEIVPKF
jgi:hypothetical protein